jgi:hypothetical protein
MRNRKGGGQTALIITAALALALTMQGLVSTGAVWDVAHEPLAPVPKAVGGYVLWPNGTVAVGIAAQVIIRNNNTGATAAVEVNPLNGAYSSNIDVDLNNIVYASCIHNNMWAQGQVKYTGQTILLCNLTFVGFPFGPQLITAAAGGSITGYGGQVTLNVPAGALGADTVIFGTDALAFKPGALDAITLLPSPLMFSGPSTLTWNYGGMNIGEVPEESLAVYTSNGGPWEKLACAVDAQADVVTAQIHHFSNFSLGGALAFGNQSGLLNAYPGSAQAPILDLTVINSAAVADTLDFVHAVSNSTDDADIAGVGLWNDIDNDGTVSAGDVQLGGTMPPGGSNFTALGLPMPAGASMDLLLTFDVAAAATPGHFLDLVVPAAGIGLANAGLLEQAIDPAGNVTIFQELTDPHVVYGYVRNALGPLPHVLVNVTNNRTGAIEFLMADSAGRYQVNLGFMPGGYADWDEIFVQANDTLGQTGWNVTFVDVFMFGDRCDVLVGKGPIAHDEVPANGTVVADPHANITVKITGGFGGVDLPTVILMVEGLNYTWGDANLSFSGNTLSFNTSGALGAWADGQMVDVTLWSANDSAGNPCQNAPFTWSFLVIIGVAQPPANLALSDSSGSVRVSWDASANATSYEVYRSGDRFAPWPWAQVASGIAATNWTDSAGTYSNPGTYYYIVRSRNAGGDSGNSSMGAKVRRTFTYLNPTLRTNANWISLPYSSPYKKLSDIVIAIEGGTAGADRDRIVGVYYWNATLQQRIGITWGGFGWNLANDADINPGDGICLVLSSLMAVGQQFNWTIVGTDVSSTQNFTYLNPTLRTNANWISLPYTSAYKKLSDIVVAIEGGTAGADRDRIVGVYYWNATQQQRIGITWGGFGWNLANDADINPGDGICLVLSSLLAVGQQFQWDPALIVPPVPEVHYYD